MMKKGGSFRKLMAATLAAAIVAIAASLAYLSSDPGRMPLSEILAVIFGVGLTIIVAGGLAGLMFLSSRSGRDDIVGRGRS